MERALSLERLRAALADRTGIPTAEELQSLIADVEVQLFTRRLNLPSELLDAAWYLHAIASVQDARERYTLARQRQAFQVSAHIFDLVLQYDNPAPESRLSQGFAAAIGYRRGGLEPNASAIIRNLASDIDGDGPLWANAELIALRSGLALLGLDPRQSFPRLRRWRRQLQNLAQASDSLDLQDTIFADAEGVVLASEEVLRYFAYGDDAALQRGTARLRSVIARSSNTLTSNWRALQHDLDARWVAAHLLGFSEAAQAGAIWNPDVIPPEISAAVRHSFTLGRPAALTLWEPQRELLANDPNPFDVGVRRMVLAVPTSGGKSLLAQLLALNEVTTQLHGVCYVVPTRSLGREVRRNLANRLAMIEREIEPEWPDFAMLLELLDQDSEHVEVLTPERLLYMIRHDASGVLNTFGMFIIDEAQLIKEQGRGFTAESIISILNHLTQDTDHRIVLISAAMGNVGTIAQWIAPSGNALVHQSDWRGPRRLNAVMTTTPDWSTSTVETSKSKTWPFRIRTRLAVRIHLQVAAEASRTVGTDFDNDWFLVRKAKTRDVHQAGLERDPAASTKNFVIASEMIAALGHAGSVLVVASTRKQAKMLAGGLAAVLEPNASMTPLVDFVETQLGAAHPILEMLRRGVGYHHAGLPVEVLEALEEAVRSDTLKYLVCTSTLTDGINLPVRTVVIYDQTYPGQDESAKLRGARLVNAVGRAGRAGQETEGWVVLVRAASFSPSGFEDLSPGPEALEVLSSIAPITALDSLAKLEAAMRSRRDALFDVSNGADADFASFVWLYLALEEERGVHPSDVVASEIAWSTLAWVGTPEVRPVLSALAERVRASYLETPPDLRRRWSRSGMALGSARRIEEMGAALATRVADAAVPDDQLASPSWVLTHLISVNALLALPEAPKQTFRATPQGAEFSVDFRALALAWLSGSSLPDLAAVYMAPAIDPAWRAEQIVDAVSSHLEHFLPWAVGALVDSANTRLVEVGSDSLICPELGPFLRYGVDDVRALGLVLAGIRSRRLANRIVSESGSYGDEGVAGMREWLRALPFPDWASHLSPTSSDVIDLLDFVRSRKSSRLRTLLEAGEASIPLSTVSLRARPELERLRLERVPDEGPVAPWGLVDGADLVALVPAQEQSAVTTIVESGVEFAISLRPSKDSTNLVFQLRSDE